MTENKRFTITPDFEEHHRQIRDNNVVIMGCFVEPQAEVIVDMLNRLNNENEQLKQFQNKVAEIINSHMEDNCCNDYKMEVLKKIWRELDLDKMWFE